MRARRAVAEAMLVMVVVQGVGAAMATACTAATANHTAAEYQDRNKGNGANDDAHDCADADDAHATAGSAVVVVEIRVAGLPADDVHGSVDGFGDMHVGQRQREDSSFDDDDWGLEDKIAYDVSMSASIRYDVSRSASIGNAQDVAFCARL